MRARAMVAFSGGFGPVDELPEALTRIQTVKTAPIPIVLFGEELWRDIINFEGMTKAGSILEQDFALVIYVETTEAAWNAIRNHYGWPDVLTHHFIAACQAYIDFRPTELSKGYRHEPARPPSCPSRRARLSYHARRLGRLSAKLTWQAGYKTAFLSGSCVAASRLRGTRPRLADGD